jgi:hypothetical protein
MSESRKWLEFSSEKELMAYLKEHADDIESLVVPIQPEVQMTGQGLPPVRFKTPCVVLNLCNGAPTLIHYKIAEKLINDGVLQRLNIPCVLDTLGVGPDTGT